MDVDPQRLRKHITATCETPRPAESRELEAAREYVTGCLTEAGWRVDRQAFRAQSDRDEMLEGINLVAEHQDHPWGSGPRFCVGAHLDSRPDSPGADDNGSAVAALLEIARLLPTMWPKETALSLELVAFDLEENGMLGGAFRAKQARTDGIDLKGMVSLEMLGYCDPRPKSQQLPKQLVGLYPDTGDFIAIIGNQNSQALIERFSTGMRKVEGLPVETLCVPNNGNDLQATRLSDHSPYWDEGFAALMVTDTSFLRNPHYHTMGDTIDTLDFDFLQRVTEGCLLATKEILTTGL